MSCHRLPILIVLAVALPAGCAKKEPPAVVSNEPPEGRWRAARSLDPDLDAKIAELESVAYVSGSRPASNRLGITVDAKDRTYPGLNLYTSGHAPVAILMDMSGKKLHTWECEFDRALPDYPTERYEKSHFRRYFRRVHLFPNGDLLVIFEGHALIKLSKDSDVLWTYAGKAHHDLEVADDGRIFVLTRTAHLNGRVNPREPILEDFIAVLSADGKELERVSVLECFESSGFANSLARMPRSGDVLHTNTIELLDGSLADRVPAFAAGNLLISVLKTNTIAVVDLAEKKVVWAANGSWVGQHQPTVLESGRLLLFDNKGDGSGFGKSRVLELDPSSADILWSYTGAADAPLETDTCGTAERLKNGNTLITESDNGRALEIAPDGEIVWEFLSPHRAGPGGRLIATLFEVIRLPDGFPVDWMD